MTVYESEAFVYLGRPGAVERQTIEVECGPTDLVLEIEICARCGTDKTIYGHGHPNVDPYAPVVLGHELVGRIVEVGKQVSTLTEGIGYREGEDVTCLLSRLPCRRAGGLPVSDCQVQERPHANPRANRQSLFPD